MCDVVLYIIREFRKPFPELIFPFHLLKCGGNQKMRRDQQMSSNVQDKKIKDKVGLVSEVLNFTSVDPRKLRTSKNAAECKDSVCGIWGLWMRIRIRYCGDRGFCLHEVAEKGKRPSPTVS